MSKENLERIIPNEVILVGKLRDENDVTVIDSNLPEEDKIKAVLAKYKFTRDTKPNAAAVAAGFQSGKFFHIQMGDPGGETIVLPNGTKVRRSRKTTKPGFDVIFAASRATTFEEIKAELLEKRVELVGGDPSNGKLKLKEYALMGFWDEFSAGFFYTPHFYDAKQGGKLVPLMSHPKQPDGSYSKTGVPAVSNTGRQFVFEDEVYNLDALRDAKISQFEKWKVTVQDNTKAAGDAGTGTPEPEKKDDDV